MILFRADGGPSIGAGHIMRCLSLAQAFRAAGRNCAFILAKPEMAPLVEKNGFPCYVLNTDPFLPEKELPALRAQLHRLHPCCMVLDSYFITADYCAALGTGLPLIWLDDLGERRLPVDLYVNYNLHASRQACEALYADGPRPAFLLGPRYVPLRPQFSAAPPRSIPRMVHRILVLTGGSDPVHLAVRWLEHLRQVPELAERYSFTFVLGAASQDGKQAAGLAARLPSCRLLCDVREMAALMNCHEMAVAAAGSTLYELCACGLPAVVYVAAGNQLPAIDPFVRRGLALYAGDSRRGDDFLLRLDSQVRRLAQDEPLRRQMSRAMQQTVPGNGAENLAGKILQILSTLKGKKTS